MSKSESADFVLSVPMQPGRFRVYCAHCTCNESYSMEQFTNAYEVYLDHKEAEPNHRVFFIARPPEFLFQLAPRKTAVAEV